MTFPVCHNDSVLSRRFVSSKNIEDSVVDGLVFVVPTSSPVDAEAQKHECGLHPTELGAGR